MIEWKRLSFFDKPISAASLAVFRIGFGLMMAGALLRFLARGWVQEFLISPSYHFTYYGFSWIKVWPAWGLYLHFFILILAALGVAFGFYYRISISIFFLGFTYLELMDKSLYLNHYYFISLVSGLMIFLPLNRFWSWDAKRDPKLYSPFLPTWPLYILRSQLGLVYFFAGIAKLKVDWLFHAQPLKIWLAANSHFPVLGSIFHWDGVAYAMSWIGALFDLTIPFWLSWKKSRPWAYGVVVSFHIITWKLFPIGMFPWIMIFSTLIFFEPNWPLRCLKKIKKLDLNSTLTISPSLHFSPKQAWGWGLFFVIQILMPLRHHLYPGNVLWNEEGFRFSWKVMLMEKTGVVDYWVRDPKTGRTWEVSPREYLKPNQMEEFSTQPDMILALAHHIAKDFDQRGIKNVEVRVRTQTSLNGRAPQALIDPNEDLAQAQDKLTPQPWILPAPLSSPP